MSRKIFWNIKRSHFIAFCEFFELSRTLISLGLIDQDVYFGIFNPSSCWRKAKHIAEGMREIRLQVYENFEMLSEKKVIGKRTELSIL